MSQQTASSRELLMTNMTFKVLRFLMLDQYLLISKLAI
jgi:hypothetical protein